MPGRPMIRRRRPEAEEAGFTLVEVLVAFALVALGLMTALQVAGSTGFGLRRVAAADIAIDEAEGIVTLQVAGDLRPGLMQGTFSDGAPWSLAVTEAAGWPQGPPLWRLRLTRGGPGGPAVYVTLVAGGYGG